jgi:hypothetical protein
MRAQSSLEYLVVLAVALLALLVFMSISQSESVNISTTKADTEAKNAAADLGAAAEEVYSQGSGARKRVSVKLPNTYEYFNSGVGDGYIRINADGSDYVKALDFELFGSLPQTSGYHEVWVESSGNRVKVGNALFTTDRAVVNAIIAKNDSRVELIKITNLWTSDINVNVSSDWSHTDLSMGISDTSFVINRADSYTISLSFSSNDIAEGFYSTTLNISADDGAGSAEYLLMPITVEVELGDDTGDGPPLVVVPSSAYFNLSRNSSDIASFQVCTNSETTLSYVDFSTSVGVPGEWIGMTDQMTNLEAGECYPKTLSVSVPDDAEFGNHSGFVYLTGDAYEAADVISIAVNVGGATNDTEAPDIESVTTFPSGPVFVNRPVAIRAIVDDSSLGDNPIAGCNVSIDSGNFSQMISKDGHFDEIRETAGYTYYSGFDLGNHQATVRCADSYGNIAEQNETFNVLKEFLFITENSTPNTEEQAWLDWIDLGLSDEGFAWNYDTVDSSTFISGTPDTGFYSVLLAEVWVSGMETRLNTHTGAGGSIVMLGHAAGDSPNPLGLSSSAASNDSNTNINVVDNTHYITSGYDGVTSVTNTTVDFGLFWKDVGGSILAKSLVSSPPHWKTLAVNGNQYFWGPTTPEYFNSIGVNITVRTLDHAVNASSIQ